MAFIIKRRESIILGAAAAAMAMARGANGQTIPKADVAPPCGDGGGRQRGRSVRLPIVIWNLRHLFWGLPPPPPITGAPTPSDGEGGPFACVVGK